MNNSHAVRNALRQVSPADLPVVLGMARQARNTGVFDEDTVSLFVVPAFLELRIKESDSGSAELIQDFNILSTDAPCPTQFRHIRDGLALSERALTTDPTQLCTQLMGRLSPDAGEYVNQLLENLKAEYPKAFHPLRTTLIQAADSFQTRRVSKVGVKSILRCGESIVVLDDTGIVRLLDVESLSELKHVRIPDAESMVHGSEANQLLVATKSGLIVTVEINNGAIVHKVTSPFERVVELIPCADHRIVVIHSDGLSVVRAADGTELVRVGASEGADRIFSAAIVPGTDQIVTGGPEGRIDLWNGSTGRLIRRIGWFGDYREDHMSDAEGLMGTLIEGGTWIAGEGYAERMDFEGLIGQIPGLNEEQRRQARKMLRTPFHNHAVTFVAVTPEADKVIAATVGGELAIVNLDSGENAGRINGHSGKYLQLDLSADGKYLVSIGEGAVQTWDVTKNLPLARLPVQGQEPSEICMLSEKGAIIGGNSAGTLTRWNFDPNCRRSQDESGIPAKVLVCFPHNQTVLDLKRNGTLVEWSGEACVPLSESSLLNEEIDGLAVDDSGSRVVAWSNNAVSVVDLRTRLQMFGHTFESDEIEQGSVASTQEQANIRSGIQQAAVSSSGQEVVLYCSGDALLGSMLAGTGKLLLLRFPSGETQLLMEEIGRVSHLAISPDGSTLCCVSTDAMHNDSVVGGLQIWDLTVPRLRTRVERGTSEAFAAFRKNGKEIVYCDGATLMRVSATSAEPSEELVVLPNGCRELTIASDERHATVITEDNMLELWDLDQKQFLARYYADRAPSAHALSLHSGRVFVSDAEGGMHILDAHVAKSSRAARESEDSLSGDGSSFAEKLDSISTLAARGKVGESLDLLEKLGFEKDNSVTFSIGIARQLHDNGRGKVAASILVGLATNEDLKFDERRQVLDMCCEIVVSDGVVGILKTPSNDIPKADLVGLLIDTAEWLANHNYFPLLVEVAADASLPAVHRLGASETLAARNNESGLEFISKIAIDNDLDPEVRCLAWCDLRRLMKPRDWLDAVIEALDQQVWPKDVRLRLADEMRSLTSINGSLIETSKGRTLREIGILRTANEWNNAALRLASEGDFEAAIMAATRAIRRCPDGARYYHTRGMSHLGAGCETHDLVRFKASIEDFSHTIKLDRNHEGAWSQRGYAHSELGNYELALQDIENAISLDGLDSADHQNRSRCLRELGRFEEADQAQQLADQLRQGRDQQGGIPLVASKHRSGDEPWPSADEISKLRVIAVEGLSKLGILDETIDHLMKACLDRRKPDAIVKEAITELAGLEAWSNLRSLVANGDLEVTLRLWAADALARAYARRIFGLLIGKHRRFDLV